MIIKKLITTLVLLPFLNNTMDAQVQSKGYEKKIDSIIQTEFGNKNEPGVFF